MSKVLLSDVCEISSGQPAPQKKEIFGDDGYPFIRAGSLEALIDGNGRTERILPQVGKELRLRLFPRNTILFAKSGMSAKIGRVYKLEEPSYVVSHLAAIIPHEDKIDPEWLKRWLEYNPPSRLIPNEAYPSIKLSEIAKLQLKLEAINRQKEISGFLKNADKLRQTRKEQLVLLDNYLKSIFFNMFGDPVTNEKDWPIEELKINAERICVAYVGPCNEFYTSSENGVPMIRTGNLKENRLDLSNLKYVTKEFHNKQKKSQLQEGDLLIARRGINGQAALVPRGIGVANALNIVIIRPDRKKYDPLFLSFCFNSKSNLFSLGNRLSGSTQNVINTRAIQDHKLIRPYLYLQNDFSGTVEKVEAIKQEMYESLTEMDNHFNALTQKYFG